MARSLPWARSVIWHLAEKGRCTRSGVPDLELMNILYPTCIYIYIHIYIYTRYTYCRNSLRPQLGSWVVIKMIPGSCTFPGAAQAPQMMGSYPRKPDFVSKIFWSKKRMGPPVELAFSCLEKAAEFYGLL